MTDQHPVRSGDECGDPHGPGALTLDEAHERVAAAIRPVRETQTTGLRASLGRMLATDVVSPIDIPPAANAAMDGYAFRAADLDDRGAAELRLVGTAWAGHPLDRTVGAGECARIMTGAPLPAGADTVVMQERTEVEGERVRVWRAEPGANIRAAGEDIATGQLALSAGTWLGPAEIGVLASLGMTRIDVFRRPRVALFASGDEIAEPGQPLAPGRLYDSNRYTVHAMLDRLGMEVDDLGHLPDDRDAVEASLAAAAGGADAIITTGGVSVGAADHIGPALGGSGEIIFQRVAIKPGRPLNFGRLGDTLFFGLPGNPVSAMVTFYQFVQPALRCLAGGAYRRPLTLRARTSVEFSRKPGRTEFQRAILRLSDEGVPEVERAGQQGSGRLSSMAQANCLVLLPAESGDVPVGSWVDVQPFEGLV